MFLLAAVQQQSGQVRRSKNKVGKPTSAPLPLTHEGLGHFAAPSAVTQWHLLFARVCILFLSCRKVMDFNTLQWHGLSYRVKTTGLAGGLLCPYKGLLPAWALRLVEKVRLTHCIYLLALKGLFFLAYVYWLTRKRVNILFQWHLIIYQIFL